MQLRLTESIKWRIQHEQVGLCSILQVKDGIIYGEASESHEDFKLINTRACQSVASFWHAGVEAWP